jgi:ankyrin repeat protein
MARLLLDAGANARAVQADGELTALHLAVGRGSVKTVRVLLSAGIEVDAMSQVGLTPLLGGVRFGRAATVPLFLKAGADPSRTGIDLTPLQLACKQGLLEIAGLLLRAGADSTALDADGETALHTSIREGHAAVVRLLLTVVDVEEPGVGELTTPLWTAVVWGRAEIVHVLLEAGADVTRLSLSGYTLLHETAKSGSVELTREMLKAGLHPDDVGSIGIAPLQYCAIYGKPGEGVLDCIRVLIEAGADLSTRGFRGNTALTFAAAVGNVEIVRLLLAAGAPTSPADDSGQTALHHAARNGHADVVEELLVLGARRGAQDGAGRSPLLLALDSGNADIVRILLGESRCGGARPLADG